MDLEPRKMADLVIQCAFDKKGEDIALINIGEVSTLCDYFVVISGNSRTQTRAICDHIEDTLEKKYGIKEKKIQGKEEGGWILMDYGIIVVHIFLENIRSYYNLKELWQEAKIEYVEDKSVKELEVS